MSWYLKTSEKGLGALESVADSMCPATQVSLRCLPTAAMADLMDTGAGVQQEQSQAEIE